LSLCIWRHYIHTGLNLKQNDATSFFFLYLIQPPCFSPNKMASTQNHSGILFQSDNLIPVTASNQYLDTGIFKVFFLTSEAFLPVPKFQYLPVQDPLQMEHFRKMRQMIHLWGMWDSRCYFLNYHFENVSGWQPLGKGGVSFRVCFSRPLHFPQSIYNSFWSQKLNRA